MANTRTTNDARLADLARELEMRGVPAEYYSLGKHRDERTCLVPSDMGWRVYYAERGALEDLREFQEFDEAKKFLLAELSK